MRVLQTLLACCLLIGSSAIHSSEVQLPKQAGIASAHPMATAAGHKILAQGGNAFDAAIAVSATLAVVEQQSSGIGGGGFWLLHRAQDGKNVMIDGREVAPAAAHADMYLDENGEVNRDLALNGPLAAAIPGEIAGFEHLAKHYGRLPLAVSLQPAIEAAAKGFPAYPRIIRTIERKAKVLKRYPASMAVYLPNGQVPKEGELIIQSDLANTLKAVAKHGKAGFYAGEVAEKMVQAVRENGGIWTLEDLQNYTIKERDPITTNYRGHQLVTAAPPSSGGIAIATILNILSAWDLTDMDRVKRIHLVTEAMRRAYRDRSIYLGDTDFVEVPIQLLTHPYYAAGLRASISPVKAMPSDYLPGINDNPKGEDTTHFSIIDTEGNMVSATLTVNTGLASGFIATGTGVLLNNEMDDFSAKPGEPNAFGLIGDDANKIEPGKRPLSSMSPTFVFSDDQVAVLGTPGGSRIITMVLLGLLDHFDGNNVHSWVSKPRYHHQYLPDKLYLEKDALDPATIEALQAKGHVIHQHKGDWGNMHAVSWNKTTGAVDAASDPRTTTGSAVVK
ncbi:gamma-glutamyltransferase [Marinicella meishanensis]|uniref:gamma-glutamyltransferase n=1 Tax=Marinicella meishanensis TaxID=2873263 RepID=UPI001CBA9867|nr:gamma-glutamyltransferase [Marinicella sp. NBU2979]